MSDDLTKIDDLFAGRGWQTMETKESARAAGLVRLYSSSYAAIGLAICESVSALLAAWDSCQVEMSALRSQKAVPETTDLYLLLVVPSVGEDGQYHQELQAVINDTHVCRKIVVEKKGRLLEESLDDTPFFATTTELAKDFQTMDPLSPDPAFRTVLPMLLDDLARRSASSFLDNLLTGKYRK